MFFAWLTTLVIYYLYNPCFSQPYIVINSILVYLFLDCPSGRDINWNKSPQAQCAYSTTYIMLHSKYNRLCKNTSKKREKLLSCIYFEQTEPKSAQLPISWPCSFPEIDQARFPSMTKLLRSVHVHRPQTSVTSHLPARLWNEWVPAGCFEFCFYCQCKLLV